MSENENQHVEFELQMDLNEVDAWGGESGPPLPIGVYDFEITSVMQANSTKQKPVIKLEFTVLNEGPYFGKSITKSYSLQPKALGRIKNVMMAVGARIDGIRSSELLNKQLVAEIVHTQGDPQPQPDGSMTEGKMFADVINERAPEGVEQAAPPPADTKPAPAPTPPPATNAKGAAVRRAIGAAKPA